MALVRGDSASPNEAAVLGVSTATDAALAIYGNAEHGSGVIGESVDGTGVVGKSVDWIGVYGESAKSEGVRGTSNNRDHAGVVALNPEGGAALYSKGAVGVQATGTTWIGVYGETEALAIDGAAGVLGDGKEGGDGVKGHARGLGKAAVAGIHLAGSGPGVYGEGAPAGRFNGDVEISGALTVAGVGLADLLARVAALEAQLASSESGLQAALGSLETRLLALQSEVVLLQTRVAALGA